MPARRGPAAFVRCGAERAGPAFVRRGSGPGPGGGGRGGRGRGEALFCPPRPRLTLGLPAVGQRGRREPQAWQVAARGPRPGLPALGRPRSAGRWFPHGAPGARAMERPGPPGRLCPARQRAVKKNLGVEDTRVSSPGRGHRSRCRRRLLPRCPRRCRDVSGHRLDKLVLLRQVMRARGACARVPEPGTPSVRGTSERG